MRTHLKAHLLTTGFACSFLALTPTFAQTPPTDAGLLANPVYVKSCAKCHGKTAEGRHFGGPALISAKTAASSPEDLHNIIATGKGHMPKFADKIAAEQIDALVREIQLLNKK